MRQLTIAEADHELLPHFDIAVAQSERDELKGMIDALNDQRRAQGLAPYSLNYYYQYGQLPGQNPRDLRIYPRTVIRLYNDDGDFPEGLAAKFTANYEDTGTPYYRPQHVLAVAIAVVDSDGGQFYGAKNTPAGKESTAARVKRYLSGDLNAVTVLKRHASEAEAAQIVVQTTPPASEYLRKVAAIAESDAMTVNEATLFSSSVNVWLRQRGEGGAPTREAQWALAGRKPYDKPINRSPLVTRWAESPAALAKVPPTVGGGEYRAPLINPSRDTGASDWVGVPGQKGTTDGRIVQEIPLERSRGLKLPGYPVDDGVLRYYVLRADDGAVFLFKSRAAKRVDTPDLCTRVSGTISSHGTLPDGTKYTELSWSAWDTGLRTLMDA